MKRRIYLKKKTLAEAQELIRRAISWKDFLGSERIPTRQALGRITAEALYARFSVPAFNAAAMDGIAVKAEKTFSASEHCPLRLKIGEEAFYVNTGDVLPPDTDAVIMIEEVHLLSPEEVEIMAPAYPWQHVRKIGEDVVEGELLFPPFHHLAAWDLGALLATGHLEIPVKERPRVAIIPTGDELLLPEEAKAELLASGRTVEFNSTMISALVEEWGGLPEVFPLVPDKREEIKAHLLKAAEDFHLVVILAGSSAGAKDHTAGLIEELGELLLHGVAIMPGKPAVFGIVKGCPVFGAPGYPVSAVIAFEKLMKPAFEAMYGVRIPEHPRVEAFCGRKIPSRPGTREFLRVKVGEVAGKRVFITLKRGAGAITTLSRADALCEIPEAFEGLAAGERVKLELLRPEKDFSKTALVVGSHDMALDILAEFLKKRNPLYEFSTAHVGSLSGILAVRDNLAHLAGTHLFDPESGEFNIPYLERYLKDKPVVLVHFAFRQQGLILPKGNPAGVKDLQDIAQKGLRFVNRQPGAGTRVLFDFYLHRLGINPRDIRGYENEETTHLGVAVAVATGRADVGLGILAAARLLGLDFVPLFRERYDLLVRRDFFEGPFWREIASVLASETFRKRVVALGGYDVSETGKILYETF